MKARNEAGGDPTVIGTARETTHACTPERSAKSELAQATDKHSPATLGGELLPEGCPRFEKCAAPLCPLDPEWRRRKHLQGERVCYFLREAVKDGAAARFEATANAEIVAAATQMLSEPENLGAYVRQRLRDAAQTDSRVDRARRLRFSGGGNHEQ
jgi:hypothetical protein